MSHKVITPTLSLVAMLVLGSSLSSCNRGNSNTSSVNSAISQTSPAPPPKTGFEADLEYVRKGQYTYVWIFSRKDGKELMPEDSQVLHTNAPKVVDWVKTDQNRVIAGSNFPIEAAQMVNLQKRFKVEDYSGK